MSEIEKKVRQIRFRLKVFRILDWSFWGLIIGLSLAALVLLTLKLFENTIPVQVVIPSIIGGSLFISLIIGAFSKLGLFEAAMKADQVLSLRERLSSVLALSRKEGVNRDAFEALEKDAQQYASSIQVGKDFKYQVPSHAKHSIWPALALVALFFAPQFNLFESPAPPPATVEKKVLTAEEKKEREKIVLEMKRLAEEVEKKEEETLLGTDKEVKLADKLEKLSRDLSQGRIDDKEAIAEMSRMNDELGLKKNEMSKKTQPFKQIKGLQKSKHMQDIQKDLKNQDFEQAAQKMVQMAQQLQQMDTQQLQELSQELEDLSEQIQENQQMAQAMKQAAQAVKQMAEQKQQQQNQQQDQQQDQKQNQSQQANNQKQNQSGQQQKQQGNQQQSANSGQNQQQQQQQAGNKQGNQQSQQQQAQAQKQGQQGGQQQASQAMSQAAQAMQQMQQMQQQMEAISQMQQSMSQSMAQAMNSGSNSQSSSSPGQQGQSSSQPSQSSPQNGQTGQKSSCPGGNCTGCGAGNCQSQVAMQGVFSEGTSQKEGFGSGGPGRGNGGNVPFDNSMAGGFKDVFIPGLKNEDGEIIAVFETNASAAPGESKISYSRVPQSYKQQAADTIIQEDIPVGVRNKVLDYFESINFGAEENAQ